jgi:hypothetical protein
MASSLTLKVANFTSTLTLNLSDTQVAQVLMWFVEDKATPPDPGLTQAQLNQYYLDAARDEIKRYIIQEAQKNRLRDLRAQQQSVEAQATADTAI